MTTNSKGRASVTRSAAKSRPVGKAARNGSGVLMPSSKKWRRRIALTLSVLSWTLLYFPWSFWLIVIGAAAIWRRDALDYLLLRHPEIMGEIPGGEVGVGCPSMADMRPEVDDVLDIAKPPVCRGRQPQTPRWFESVNDRAARK